LQNATIFPLPLPSGIISRCARDDRYHIDLYVGNLSDICLLDATLADEMNLCVMAMFMEFDGKSQESHTTNYTECIGTRMSKIMMQARHWLELHHCQGPQESTSQDRGKEHLYLFPESFHERSKTRYGERQALLLFLLFSDDQDINQGKSNEQTGDGKHSRKATVT
jgi:hypothetical protein